MLSLLGAPVGDGTPELLQTTFPSTGERTVDVLARVAPGRLVHVECQTRPEPGMALRMLDYRTRIMLAHPKDRLQQYVLVLGEGTITDYDDPEAGFRGGFETIYLRERDPAELLTEPRLAPFAALAGDPATAKVSLIAAWHLILDDSGPHTAELLHHTTVLAGIRLDRNTIEQAWKEAGMITDGYAELEEPFRQEYLRRGRAEGLAEGLAKGRAELLRTLLRNKFGDHPAIPVLAERLATQRDSAAVDTITSAASIDDITAAVQDVPAPPRQG